jgi:hypothetical protein
MRHVIGLAALCLLASCAGSPPKPPVCEGDFRPVNQRHITAAPEYETSVLCEGESHVQHR